VEFLHRADLVIFDRLVPLRLLEHVPASAERICLAELTGCHPDRWPHAHEMMVAAARQGKCVVRLKGGDPFLFSRGGEEAEALRRAGIEFEIVPGITAGLAAPAWAGIPLTHRLHASAVAFVTGHEQPDKPQSNLDWQGLARFPGTLVIYMGLARLEQNVEALLRHGKEPATPAVAIQQGTMPQQKTVAANLIELPGAVRKAGLCSPVVVVIGSVALLRPSLSWFERLPLFGKCILITRPQDQGKDLADRLEELGASTAFLPAVTIGPPASWDPVDQVLSRVVDYDWLVFTSVNGVRAFVDRLLELGRDLRSLGHLKIAAIGPATASALLSYHLRADLIPATYSSEGLAGALAEHVAGRRVLLARADRGREVLREELARTAHVDEIALYSQTDNVSPDPLVLDALREGRFDWITVTSANIARSLARLLPAELAGHFATGRTTCVSISPITSAAMREAGLPVGTEAAAYTAEGMVEALLRVVQNA
jgi:uroporphyrinogen III methyltransferase/synthase